MIHLIYFYTDTSTGIYLLCELLFAHDYGHTTYYMIGTLMIPITPILQERLLGYQRRLMKYAETKIVMSENKILFVSLQRL